MPGDDSTLIKIAVFGVTMSIFCTAMFTIMLSGAAMGDYDLDEIAGYRDDLVNFSGETMLNQNPWILTSVKTPWVESMGTDGHIDADGWLYGESIDYDGLNSAAAIRLDPNNKSSVPLTISEQTVPYEVTEGFQWWVDGGGLWSFAIPFTYNLTELLGGDPVKRSTETATIYNYTGYRYVFDPTLPFAVDDEGNRITQASARDGSLSIVWYNYAGQEGLSGALQVYGGDVLLASYAATDIIAAYNGASGYATTYDFNFNGAVLTLSIKFDEDVIAGGMPLMQAWANGNWTMAISSLSAGNFFDVANSVSFDLTAGGMIDTFTNILKMDMPYTTSPWANLVMWILVVLPMTLALACVTLKLISSIRIFGGI